MAFILAMGSHQILCCSLHLTKGRGTTFLPRSGSPGPLSCYECSVLLCTDQQPRFSKASKSDSARAKSPEAPRHCALENSSGGCTCRQVSDQQGSLVSLWFERGLAGGGTRTQACSCPQSGQSGNVDVPSNWSTTVLSLTPLWCDPQGSPSAAKNHSRNLLLLLHINCLLLSQFWITIHLLGSVSPL